jgi:DUF971 family protein
MLDNTRIKQISQQGDRKLAITWSDNKEDIFDVVDLRRKCPCASCIDEWTREQILKPDSVPETVRPLTVNSVGRYALNIKFNDGHGSGIYTFTMLRKHGAMQ